MKTSFLAILLVITNTTVFGQSERFVTLTAGPGSGLVGTTNQVSIAASETAQIMAFTGTPINGAQKFTVVKDGLSFTGTPTGVTTPNITPAYVGGPAQIVLSAGYNQIAMLTLKILPDTYDVNNSVILPPGTNIVNVALQTSTDLINWTNTTNGDYGGTNVARFFRIRLTAP